MTWIKLALILTLTHFSTTLPLDPHPSPDRPYSPSFLPSPQDTYEPQHPSLALTLPDPQPNPVAFYVPEPETLLKAPSESLEPDFYRVPIPEQDLVAPKEQTKWNPDNNPDYYFEVPSVVTKQELPTQEFPKKYNKEVHDKDKPYNLRPKEVVVFEKIDGRRYQEKQNELEKKFENLAKKENQKVVKMLPTRNKKPSNSEPLKANNKSADQIRSATFDRGLSSELTASLGIPSLQNSKGERLEFQMAGHDGPLSYKWGYDTGEGPNRLFRYEERDKEGIVKGHYGFNDKEGKLQVIHYDAHPETGFHVSENS